MLTVHTNRNSDKRHIIMLLVAALIISSSVGIASAEKHNQVSANTVTGAAFPVPESLQDEVEEYRSNTGRNLGAKAFVLATENELYIVFTSEQPQKGVASVSGLAKERAIESQNLTFGAIAATTVEFDTKGTKTSIRNVNNEPNKYRLRLVRISATHREISTITDPDQGSDFTFAQSAGVLVNDPKTASELFKNSGSKLRKSVRSRESNITKRLDKSGENRLATFSFENQMWTDAPASVDGIVLAPGGAAREYVSEFDNADVLPAKEGRPLIYVVDQNYEPRSIEDISTIKKQPDAYDGEIVSITINAFQATLSAQEVIEHNGGCSKDLVQAQSGCINLPQDFLIHTGVAWQDAPRSRDDILLIAGVSARHQDEPFRNRTGNYRLVGEIVSTSRIDQSLPDANVLLVYEIERRGNIDFRSLSDSARARIINRTSMLEDKYRGGLLKTDTATSVSTEQPSQSSQTDPNRARGVSISRVPAGETVRLPLSSTGAKETGVKEVSITAEDEIIGLNVTTSPVEKLPPGVDQPPGNLIRIFNISASASDSKIDRARITMRIERPVPNETQVIDVYRYEGDEWEEAAEVNRINETDKLVTIRARVSGFSIFTVTYETTEFDLITFILVVAPLVIIALSLVIVYKLLVRIASLISRVVKYIYNKFIFIFKR